jgi:hypothetical protein
MYQYNDRLTQLFTKYKYIWLWLQCFDPYLGHRQVYIMNLESVVHVLGFHAKRDPVWFTVLSIINQPTCTHLLSNSEFYE